MQAETQKLLSWDHPGGYPPRTPLLGKTARPMKQGSIPAASTIIWKKSSTIKGNYLSEVVPFVVLW